MTSTELGQRSTLRAATISDTKIRRATTPVIRRAIDDDTWNNVVTPRVAHGRSVTVTRNGARFYLFREGGALKIQQPGRSGSTAVPDAALTRFRQEYTFEPEDLPSHVTNDADYTQTRKQEREFTVTEFPGQPLSLVHHTAASDGSNPHLTVENAHVLGLYDAARNGDFRSKVGIDKGAVDTRLLSDYRIPAIDNLNFFAAPQPKRQGNGKGKQQQPTGDAVRNDISLLQYLRFIEHALARCGIEPEFGQRIETMAAAMARTKHFDLAAMFLREGMDESSFIRAVLAVDAAVRTAQGDDQGLVLDQEIRDVFRRWWNVADNDVAVPYLPELADGGPAPGAAERPLLRQGEKMADETSYATVERTYAMHYFPAVAAAARAWTPA